MAWNHPNSNCEKPSGVSNRVADWLYVKIAFALILIVVASCLLFLRKPFSLINEPLKTNVRKIPEAIPQFSTNIEKVVKCNVSPLVFKTGLKTYRDANGILRFESGQRVYDPSRPVEHYNPSTSSDIFPHFSENTLADLLTLEAGDMIAGEQKYDESFIEDFKNSLTNKIIHFDTDSDYVQEVKDMVIESKRILKGKMDQGEDIAKILNDFRVDMENLMTYRSEVLDMVRGEIDRDDFSDNDVEDLVNAANLMLREKGIKEINDNEFSRYGLIMEMKRSLQKEPQESDIRDEN